LWHEKLIETLQEFPPKTRCQPPTHHPADLPSNIHYNFRHISFILLPHVAFLFATNARERKKRLNAEKQQTTTIFHSRAFIFGVSFREKNINFYG
jgi:hypothetical protein